MTWNRVATVLLAVTALMMGTLGSAAASTSERASEMPTSRSVRCGTSLPAHRIKANRLSCKQAKKIIHNYLADRRDRFAWVCSYRDSVGPWLRYSCSPIQGGYLGPGRGYGWLKYRLRLSPGE